MHVKYIYRGVSALLVAVLLVSAGTATTFAVTSSSPNYRLTETEFGANSLQEGCSDVYCATVTIGDLGASSSASSAEFGSIEYSDPVLEVIIEPGESNLGVLTTETTATKTVLIKIRNYLSTGYALQIVGSAPQFEGHVLSSLGAPTASNPGTEQFGLNVTKNTMPAVGEYPQQLPKDQEIFGVAEEGYGSPNLFQYTSGATVARGLTDVGQTHFTVSMIVNIDNSTPAGSYSGDFLAVVIPDF